MYGGLKEAHVSEIDLTAESALSPKTSINLCKRILRYIYTGKINVSSLKLEEFVQLIGLVHLYGFEKLQQRIVEYVYSNLLSLQNVIEFFRIANLYNIEELKSSCFDIIDNNSTQFIKDNKKFHNLTVEEIKAIVSRDFFYAEELELFHAIKDWYNENNNARPDAHTEVWNVVRYQLLTQADIVKVVKPLKLVPLEILFSAIESQMDNNPPPYRVKRLVGENIATIEHGAKVIVGRAKSTPKNTPNAILNEGRTMYTSLSGNEGIIVELGEFYCINMVQLCFDDSITDRYAIGLFVIEVSQDQQNWNQVASGITSIKEYDFEKCCVRFIRVQINNTFWRKNQLKSNLFP